ncbi:MAG: Regulator of sigma D [Sodalis sp.]|nr:MAG: Regulator of sigma D [Sodalis sp.]
MRNALLAIMNLLINGHKPARDFWWRTTSGVLLFDRLKSQTKKSMLPWTKKALNAFCHQLVDYLSAGHFTFTIVSCRRGYDVHAALQRSTGKHVTDHGALTTIILKAPLSMTASGVLGSVRRG